MIINGPWWKKQLSRLSRLPLRFLLASALSHQPLSALRSQQPVAHGIRLPSHWRDLGQNYWLTTVKHVQLVKNKQDEAHEPECRHVCWRTETILIRFSSETTCGTPWRDTLRWHSCRTPFLLDTLTWHSCKTLLLDTLLVKDTLTWHFLLDIL